MRCSGRWRPVVYEAVKLEAGYRVDLMVDCVVVVEVKSVDALAPVHEAQLLTNLRLSGCRLGFLINFNAVLLKQGIKGMILLIFVRSSRPLC